MADPGRALDGRIALVTGAGQGIGRGIALGLADAGADVAVNDLVPAAAEKVADEVRARGRRALAVPANVAHVAETEAMIRAAVAGLGRLDVLVNNAGLIRPTPFGQVTERDWDDTFGVNARGLFFAMQAAAPLMTPGGAIVNISSIAGRGTNSLSPPYAASKAAVLSLTQQAARALVRQGIRVNAVCPGIVDTDFNWRLDELIGVRQQGLAPGQFMKDRAASVPLGRLAEPADIARVVVFLASSGASYITGQAVTVDGGFLMR